MTVEIRAAEPADAPVLAAVAAATFALACPPGTSPQAIEEFIRLNLSEDRFGDYLADPTRDILLAVDQRRPAGYTMLVFGDPVDEDVVASVSLRPTVELSKVYVDAGHHGSGVAPLLMAATLAAARGRGASGAWLGVNKLNARAIRFYEKCGFEIVGSKTFMVGPELHHDHVMERKF